MQGPTTDHSAADWRAPDWFTPRRAWWAGAGVYALLCVLAYVVVRPPTLLYITDYWEHRAIVAEVIRHGLHPLDPIYAEGASSRQFTPWTFLLAYVARWTGWGVDTAMMLGALLVSALFLAGIHAFARAYYAHRWAPAVLLATVTCAWGVPPLIWTGFHPLRSQLHGNYYPAELVFALTFLGWAAVVRLLRARQRGIAAGALALALVALVAIAIVTHPLNALFLLAGATALAVFDPGIAIARRGMVLALLTTGIAVSTLWPWFNPLDLAGPGTVRGQATFNDFPFFYNPLFVIAMLWPAMAALLVLPGQLRAARTRVPALAFLAIFAGYLAGAAADLSVAHRFLDYIALALQMMLTWLILGLIDQRPPAAPLDALSPTSWRVARWIAGLLIAAHLMLGVQQVIQPWALAGPPQPLRPILDEGPRVHAALPPGARVIGWDSAALVMPAFGTTVAAFPRPMPLSPTDAARQADVRRFFDYRLPDCDRRAIAARWGATRAVWLVHEVGPRIQRRLAAWGPVATPVGRWRVVAIPRPCVGASSTR